jgi:hypothetical protein
MAHPCCSWHHNVTAVIGGRTELNGSVGGWAVVDPNVWSGRALQEAFVDPADAVLHQCIRPVIGACAPGHHGYQRACDLINGQAYGPCGSPVFAGAGKTESSISSHPLADLGGVKVVAT